MMCMPMVWHISTRLVLAPVHESQHEFMGVLQHLGMWWVTIFPLTNQFPTMTTMTTMPLMTMMPLLCPMAMTHFLARRNSTTTGRMRMRMFLMVLFWSCIRKCKTCDQIDMVWTGFLAQNRNIL